MSATEGTRGIDASHNALAALMTAAGADVQSFALPGGATLMEAGETSGMIYVLRTGRLAAIDANSGPVPRLLGLIWPGEAIGEISLLADIPHTATVIALRDCEFLSMSRAAFMAAIEAQPSVLLDMVRTMIRRSRGERNFARGPSTFGFVAAHDGVSSRALAEGLARQISGYGSSVMVLGADNLDRPTELFCRLEEEHDYLFYVADLAESAWARVCFRQSDRLFWVGRGDRSPPAGLAQTGTPIQRALKPVDLILLQPHAAAHPKGSAVWQKSLGAGRLFHVRDDDAGDLARMGRLLTGRSTGLVLSGGGARGYAHIGALHALEESGVPVDFIGGASMGAVIGAGLALGWDTAEMDARVRKAFVETNPLADIAVPLLALAKGRLVEERLVEHFAEADICDLWRPFFCVSSDLTNGAHRLHDRGPLVQALRASIALPGILPPVLEGNTVLVDGGVMRNLPVDMMRAVHAGPIVAVDVSIDTGLTPKDIEVPRSLTRWLLTGGWRKGAPIVSILLRSATVTANRDLAAMRGAADIFVIPEVSGVEIRDWRAFEPAVAAGHAAMMDALSRLDRPVTELRLPRNP